MSIACAVFRGAQLLVHGELLYVFADPKTQTSRPIPPLLRDWFESFDRGEPMLQLRAGREKGGWRVVARNRGGIDVGSARAGDEPGGSVRIEAIDVHPSLRHAGIGRTLLDTLLGAVREDGARQAVVDAPLDAEPFFAGAGFVAAGGGPVDRVALVRPL
jgi:GNAT superfamily N-acetyltransferase